jgi:putative ABC transport system ATP-binding protein
MFLLKDIQYMHILNIDELKIPSKEITCIVGESGSGKTTLLRLLNKMITYTKGNIYYNGEEISTIDSIRLRREIVMLPQAPAIFPGNVRDNLLIGLRFSEKELADDAKLNEILKLINLYKSLTENAHILSGGEKQRLALGRVILMDPAVFLLDEPSSALDEDSENIVINQVVKYTKENGKTLIMVTHSKAIAKQYANSIIELKNGIIINSERNI